MLFCTLLRLVDEPSNDHIGNTAQVSKSERILLKSCSQTSAPRSPLSALYFLALSWHVRF